jgi:glutamine amidotransferase-like uncharacterized protein
MTQLTGALLLLMAFQSAGATELYPEEAYKKHPEVRLYLPEIHSLDGKPPTVGLYNDDGSWWAGVDHLKLFLQEYGYSYKSLTAEDIKNGGLKDLKLLVMPGGQSWTFLEELGDEGGEIIRNFVRDGGDYMGFCAGAFYAVSHRKGGYATGEYGIGLLNGVAYDGTALKTKPFKDGMLGFELLLKGFQKIYDMVLLGGPSFHYSQKEAHKRDLKVIARFPEINEPAMIVFNHGKGQVFLSGPHAEIEEDLLGWGDEYIDKDSEWPLLQHVIENYF